MSGRRPPVLLLSALLAATAACSDSGLLGPGSGELGLLRSGAATNGSPSAIEWEETNLPAFDANVSDIAVNADDDLFVTFHSSNQTSVTTGPGVWKSTDDGQTWESVNCGLSDVSTNVNEIAITPDGDMFVATHGKGVFRFTFGTDCWELLSSSPAMLTELVATPTALYAGDGFFCSGLEKSSDEGATWTDLGSPACVNALAANTEKGILYLGEGGNGGIWKSTDGGFTWTEKRCCLGIRDVAVDSDGNAFIGTNGGCCSPGSGVLRSTDDGETWNKVNTGLDPTEIEVVAVNLADHVFAGARGGDGIWRSTNNGDSWSPENEGLITDGGISAIAFQSSGHGVAGGETVWRTTLPTIVPFVAPTDGDVKTLFGDTDVGEKDEPYYDSNGVLRQRGEDPGPGRWHHGVDIAAIGRFFDRSSREIKNTRRVVAVADGTVIFEGEESLHGDVVVIRHDGIEGPAGARHVYSFYSHLGNKNNPNQELINTEKITEGATVRQGKVVGCQGNSGSTASTIPGDLAGGTHLHFEIRVSNRKIPASGYQPDERLKENSGLILISPDNFMNQNLTSSEIPGARSPATDRIEGIGPCPL